MNWRWGALGAFLLLCATCSLLSGLYGVIMGYDWGQREARSAQLPPSGVLVTRVQPDSPAARAGIQRGDMLIALNGVPIADVPSLQAALADYLPGDDIQLTLRQEVSDYTANLTLERFPGSDPSQNQPYMGIYFTARAEDPADV